MGLPGWARLLVFVAAIPGLIVAALSIAMFLISILALLLLAAPIYSFLKQLTRPAGSEVQVTGGSSERRQASARVIDTEVE